MSGPRRRIERELNCGGIDMSKTMVVSGQISALEAPARAGLVVRTYAKALPSLKARGMDGRQLGADALTDANGRYRIEFGIEPSDPDRGRSRLTPGLLIRVFDDETLLGESAVVFAVADDAVIDLTVAIPERSEFELLLAHVKPALQGVALAELSDEDLVFLEGVPATDPERHGIAHPALAFVRKTLSSLAGRSEPGTDWIRMLRSAAQVARETGVCASSRRPMPICMPRWCARSTTGSFPRRCAISSMWSSGGSSDTTMSATR